jgi:hypothetical protein
MWTKSIGWIMDGIARPWAAVVRVYNASALPSMAHFPKTKTAFLGANMLDTVGRPSRADCS